MADINIHIQAEALGLSLEGIGKELEAQIKQAVSDLATASYNAMVAQAQEEFGNARERQEYLRSLKIDTIGPDTYMIHLDGEWANRLENGAPSTAMNPIMLASSKIVQIGSRAGKPWVRRAKDGHKYAAVPMEHKPFSKEKNNMAMGKAIQGIMTKNASGSLQKITQIFKDIDGNPVIGKAAVATEVDTPIANLQGLTKYQYQSESGKMSSVYMTYRTISEIGKTWMTAARPGHYIFEDAEKEIRTQMDNILRTLLK